MTSEPGMSSVLGSQVMTTDVVAGQPAVESPSETVAVSVTGPGVVQTKVGVAEVARAERSRDGRPAVRERRWAIVRIVRGDRQRDGEAHRHVGRVRRERVGDRADVEGAVHGHAARRCRLVAVERHVDLGNGAGRHVEGRAAAAGRRARPVAPSVIVNPLPAGRPPMIAEIVLLEATLMVPEVEKPFGPLIV